MHWTDEGVILSARPHGESSVIVELLTRDHGRHLGLVRGGRSRTQRPVLQPGNLVRAEWRARLDEHLGNFALEGLTLRAARLMEARASVFGLSWLSSLTRLLPERDPHPAVFETLGLVLDHLEDNEIAPALLIRFELAMLSELGFGLDLSSCAATGTSADLVWVSPKSGRAVSAMAGAPYADRLLKLPDFLVGSGGNAAPDDKDIDAGFQLTGFFLSRDVYEPRGIPVPDVRAAYIAAAAMV
ncbi:DNA repair protein RecO [Flaviflagellibacter deserti]|jgi:DNA repair protein RecO (recombination protein O)|uniref:DNA repair protein RecO n=1 Tax=Flaviflagellibacter deserti TaxID=2267266 RepID=A0ABV9Z0I1_9HYPH